jgi:hypothetical protein
LLCSRWFQGESRSRSWRELGTTKSPCKKAAKSTEATEHQKEEDEMDDKLPDSSIKVLAGAGDHQTAVQGVVTGVCMIVSYNRG